MNKSELLKTMKYLELHVDDTLTNPELILLLKSSNKMRNDISFHKYDSRLRIQYNGYCYYIDTEFYYESFIVTKETDVHIYADLLECDGKAMFQVIYDKRNNTWHRFFYGKEICITIIKILFNKIKDVLYVIRYRTMINNLYYFRNNNAIIPDIHCHIKSLVISTFPKDMVVII